MQTLKAIFFDAAGTLIYLPRSVGEHYRDVARHFGLELSADAFNRAFKTAWKEAPARRSNGQPREDDDKGWWHDLVEQVLELTLSPFQQESFDKDRYFEAVYEHFTRPGVWEVFGDVIPALQNLRERNVRLGLISNFDRRLYPILENLGLRDFFEATVISSEIGADKPDPAIFQAALDRLHLDAADAMHVGDDPEKDWGAEALGLSVFRLERPKHTFDDLLAELYPGGGG